MKSTDKNLSQNKGNRQSSNILLYSLLFIVLAALVGGLVWHFWPERKGEREHNYEEVLGKFSTSPTEKEVSKLISENKNRIKTAKRVLADEMRGRKLTEKQKEEVREEFKNLNENIQDILRGQDLKELEKNHPDTLASIYNWLYDQGRVTVRLKDKTSIGRSSEELKNQEKIQSEWFERGITKPEEAAIKVEMNKWIEQWYYQAKAELIGSGPGKYPLLVDGIVLSYDEGKKIEEPTRTQINKYRKPHTYGGKDKVEKTTDFSQNLDIQFKGYYGFLTEEDKKESSEGKETFGLTRSHSAWRGLSESSKKVDYDEEAKEPIGPVPPDFYLFWLFEDNRREIEIGLEKKMFFNRLGHEEWLSEVKYKDKSTSRTYFDICFEECVETIAHELAHAIVSTIKSKYDGEEGGGHGEFFYEIMQKIEKMIKDSPDFPDFKTWWEKPEKEQKQWSRDSILDKRSHWDKNKYWYLGGGIFAFSVGGLVAVLLWDGGSQSGPKKHAKV